MYSIFKQFLILFLEYDEIENIRNQLEDGDSSQDKDIEIVVNTRCYLSINILAYFKSICSAR